jgi:hypothetical protein
MFSQMGHRPQREHRLQDLSVETSPEAVTLEQRDLTSSLTTLGKRRPRWFQETLTKARENVGEPKSQIRERRPPVRLGAYLALVTSIRDTEPIVLKTGLTGTGTGRFDRFDGRPVRTGQ